jgi:hypothetical protein
VRLEETANCIVAGYNPDPFSLLGIHRSEGGLVVRLFLPGATAVEVVSPAGDSLGELEHVHPGGILHPDRAHAPRGLPRAAKLGLRRRPAICPRRLYPLSASQ